MCYLLSRLLNVLATITASAATSPLTYRSGVRPDYATFHILRVLSSDADTTVLPSGANLHALTLSLAHCFRNIREHICDSTSSGLFFLFSHVITS
jgi:hypothetical protein